MNTYIIIFSAIGLLLIVFDWIILSGWFEKSIENHTKRFFKFKEINDKYNKPNSLRIMLKTLKSLDYKALNDGSLFVQYQGENFRIEFYGIYTCIWHTRWARIEAKDPELPYYREAANKTNYYVGPMILMSKSVEDGIIMFNSRFDIILHSSYPDNVSLIRNTLESFIDARKRMILNYHQIKAEKMGQENIHRPKKGGCLCDWLYNNSKEPKYIYPEYLKEGDLCDWLCNNSKKPKYIYPEF